MCRPVLDAPLCKPRARDRFIHGQKSPVGIYQMTCQPRVAVAARMLPAPSRCARFPVSAQRLWPLSAVHVRFATKLVLTIRSGHIKLRQTVDDAKMPRRNAAALKTSLEQRPAASDPSFFSLI